ncbi:MAG: DUF3352 domain-containing protein [Ktedonobacterales bacterium]
MPKERRGMYYMGSPYGQQPPAAANCANCGTQLDPSQRFCPTCGQPASGAAWQGGTTYQAGTSGAQYGGPVAPPSQPMPAPGLPGGYGAAPSSPLNAGFGQPPTYPPTVGATPQPGGSDPNGQPYAWTNPFQPPYAAGQQPPVVGSPFAPGQTTYQTPGYGAPLSSPSQYTPTYQSPVTPAPRRGGRGRLVAVISAICIIAVLGAGAVFAYNILAAHTENQVAKILPASTFEYTAVDLVSLANNSHHVTLNDLLNSSGASGQDAFRAVGLSFPTDVQPWLNRDVAFAIFQKDAGASTVASPLGRLGGAFLIQSRDDGAAQAAMAKAANYLRNAGSTITSSTYSSVPLYSVQTNNGGATPAVTFGAGKGWAIIALDAASAQMVINRIDGKGDTLAGSQDFQTATSNLPSNRFGTLYVNLKALVGAVSPGTGASVPFLNTYPVATGYTSWTDAGLRTAFTLQGNANVGNVTGDTKSLASMVPAGAIGYVGVANLGGLYQAGSRLSGIASDPAQTDFGIAATDPALQQPAAYAYLGTSGSQSQALYLHLTSDSVGQNIIQGLAQAHNWTAQTTTLAGQAVTVFYDTNSGSFLGNDYGYDGSNGPYAAGYAAIIHSTLVVTAKDTAMQAVVQAAQGGPSLAQDSTFSQLANAAPAGAAVTGYVNVASLASAVASGSASLASRLTAIFVTGIWNNSELQLTLDTKLNG